MNIIIMYISIRKHDYKSSEDSYTNKTQHPHHRKHYQTRTYNSCLRTNRNRQPSKTITHFPAKKPRRRIHRSKTMTAFTTEPKTIATPEGESNKPGKYNITIPPRALLIYLPYAIALVVNERTLVERETRFFFCIVTNLLKRFG